MSKEKAGEKPEVSFKVGETEYLRLDSEFELDLDSIIKKIAAYTKDNHGEGKPDEEKDELYKNAQKLWGGLRDSLTTAKFNLNLNRTEYSLLTNILTRKLEYDVDTIFVAIELTNALSEMSKVKFDNDTELKAFKVNPTELTYTYHLIAKYKVNGLTKEAYTFASVLRKIAEVSKLFNYYDSKAKYYSEYIMNWVASFEPGVSLDGSKEEVEAVEVEAK